ncbi:IS110 family transposase [Pseudomonas sp. RC10]|uniref:IS110 family transposase n=1 Tax=Pseudomonas bambusae TaxID=3139142 RepID=UPI0031393D78
MSAFVGIDIAKNSFDIATPLDNGKFRTKARLANNPKGYQVLLDWLTTHSEPHAWVVMEATSVYHQGVADCLHAHGYRVCIVNPAILHQYGKDELRRVKTDKADAKLIARYAQDKHTRLREWVPEPAPRRRLRALVRRLEDLQEIQQMESNRLDVAEDKVKASIESVISHVKQQIDETRKAIKDNIDDDPDLRQKRDLIVTIDGLGDTTAALILAELGDPLDYKGPKSIVAFAGLDPRCASSGESVGPTHISKTGSKRLRAGLYMPGMAGLKHNAVLRELKTRMRANGKAPKEIICAAMRKLLHLVYGVLKSGKPFDAEIALAR